jgi:arabinogalactan oligomer/maltooligosaccharide transport system substrate-binding protein
LLILYIEKASIILSFLAGDQQMNDTTKKCPMCAEQIPLAAVTCEYCGAQFEVTTGGYCQTCHDVREADSNGQCNVCGNAVADLRMESRLIEEPVQKLLSASQPIAQIEITKTRKSCLPIGILAGILIFTVIGVSMWFGRNILFVTPDPTATLISPITFAPSSTPDFAATDQSATATAQATLAGTLTLWHSYPPGSTDENALMAVIRNAEAENPGLHVILVNRSSSANFWDEYTTTVSAGGGPDLILGSYDPLENLVRDRVVLELDRASVEREPERMPYTLDGLMVNGSLYGIPQSSSVVAIYYHKSLVPKPPTTTEELLALLLEGRRLVAPGAMYYLHGFWSAFGGQLMDETDHCIADQAGFLPAVQYALELQKAGANFQLEYEEAQNRFRSGDSAMLINGQWALSGLEESLGDDLGVALLPSGPSGASQPLVGNSAFYINPNSADTENAIQLALFLTNQASGQIFTDEAGVIPVRNDVSISDPLLYTFSLAAIQGEPSPTSKHFNNYWTPFAQMFKDVFSNAITPQAGLKRACEAMNELNGMP